jgi:hypothetical protein
MSFLNIPDHLSTRKFFNIEMRSEKMSQGEWKEKVQNPIVFDKAYDQVLSKLLQQGINVEKLY